MAFPAQTVAAEIARAYDFQVPAATQAPNLLLGRQDDEMSTCGYWSFSDSDLPYSEYLCDSDCTTSGSYYGCADTFMTTCYNSDNSRCSSGASLGSFETCCTESTWTNCVTASKSDDGKWLEAFECWAGLSGEQFVSITPYEKTVVKTDGSSTITSTEASTVESSSIGDNNQAHETSGSNSGGGGGGSSTPVGAIVGGVIGGVALILAVAFGIWFMRSYKRKHAIQPGAEPYRMAESIGYQPGYPDQPPPGQEYYGGYQPGNAWGYALPAEQKPDQQVPLAEMPPDNNRRPGPTAELQ